MRAVLRDKIDGKELVVAPGAANPFFARMIEQVGFDAVYMTGGGTASWLLCMPDQGLTTMPEMTMNIRNICNAITVPLIADMDTGFGNAISVMRTVREYEKAGVSGFHIEDQIFPKKCGFMQGKALVPKEEFVGKIKAAVEARDDPNLLIIARCDARGTQTQQDELYDRCAAYVKAGADAVFPERPLTMKDLENDLKNISAPILLNGLRLGLSIEEVAEMGFAIVIMWGTTLVPAENAAYDFLMKIKTTRKQPEITRLAVADDIVGLAEARAYEEQFLPTEELLTRYGSKKVPRDF
jgi:2-methylisocitrate lyase-like PEP mutase family enzyme